MGRLRKRAVLLVGVLFVGALLCTHVYLSQRVIEAEVDGGVDPRPHFVWGGERYDLDALCEVGPIRGHAFSEETFVPLGEITALSGAGGTWLQYFPRCDDGVWPWGAAACALYPRSGGRSLLDGGLFALRAAGGR